MQTWYTLVPLYIYNSTGRQDKISCYKFIWSIEVDSDWRWFIQMSISIFPFMTQVLSISLAALGSLMWLRKNKPRTLIPIIYIFAGIIATMPSITRSGALPAHLCLFEVFLQLYVLSSHYCLLWLLNVTHAHLLPP